MLLAYLLAALIAYLLGSFPTGYLAGRYLGHVDVRAIGSGRTGGSNVLRSAGPSAAIVTIIGDILKGFLAVLLVRALWHDPLASAIAALFSVIGHNYSVFLRFKGGAGTMTALGASAALSPAIFLASFIIPMIFTYITRMSSIGSLLGSSIGLLVAAIFVWLGAAPPAFLVFFAPFFLLSWYSHRPNIARLKAGTERRIGERAQV